jgi:Spy/CpxP family protein refolding chaperone
MKKMLAGLMLVTMLAGVSIAQESAPRARRIDGPGHGMGDNFQFRRMGPPGMPGMGAWWKNSEIAKELNLTDAQQKQLERTFLDQRMKLIDLNADLERQELKLEPLISADTVDENAVSQQLDQVVAARGRLEKSNAMMHVAMRKVLNQEQWKKLQSMHKMRMHGPGGDRIFMRRIPGPPDAPGAPMTAPAPPPGGPSEDM